jgi:hypothetical protein
MQVLQLVRVNDDRETASFLHLKDKPFDISASADAVRQEIEEETNRSLGAGKTVSPEPIILTIRSAHVPSLTLVDMPGAHQRRYHRPETPPTTFAAPQTVAWRRLCAAALLCTAGRCCADHRRRLQLRGGSRRT